MDPLTFARACLLRGQSCILLLVVDHHGSSPGRTGFRMVVAPDGLLVGSIGGGIMEYKLVELARHQLQTGQPQTLLKRQVHRPDVGTDRSGLICSGEQTVLLLPLEPLRDVLPLTEVTAAIAARRGGAFTVTAQGFSTTRMPKRQSRTFTPPQSATAAAGCSLDWQYEEAFDPRETIHLVGAGHVGLACCELLTRLDFRIVLYDERPDTNTLHQNTYVDAKVIGSYDEVGERIGSSGGSNGHDQYVVIMTFGYRTDAVVVRQLLGRPLRYLGMMGSAAKIAQLRVQLAAEGFSPEHLARLHAPIGVSIGSRTPAEIAVSVAAELIRVRNLGAPPSL